MTKQFYAIGNSHASETSRGFLNTDFIRIFDTAVARDAWIASSPKALRACTKKEAIDTIVGNNTCVGGSCTRAQAWQEILDYNDPAFGVV